MEHEILAGLKEQKNKLLQRLAVVLDDIDECTEDILAKRKLSQLKIVKKSES